MRYYFDLVGETGCGRVGMVEVVKAPGRVPFLFVFLLVFILRRIGKVTTLPQINVCLVSM